MDHHQRIYSGTRQSRSLPEAVESCEVNPKLGESRSETEANERTRRRKPTAKGMSWVMENLKKNRTSAGAALRKQIKKVNVLLEDLCDISALERERDILDVCRDKLNEAHQLYNLKLEIHEEVNAAYQWFDMRDREHFQCRIKINEKLKTLERERSEIVSRRSSSSRSSRSSTSSVRSKRAKAAAKAASLQVEMEFIEKEAEFKRLQVMKEIAKAKAEEATMKNIEEEIAKGKQEVILKSEDKRIEFDNDMEAYFNANEHLVTKKKEPVWGKPSTIYASTQLERPASDLPEVSDSWPDLPTQDVIKQSRGITKKVELNPNVLEFIPPPKTNPTTKSRVQSTGRDSHLTPNYGSYQIPNHGPNENQQDLSSVLELLTKQQGLNCLPKQQPPVFSGSYFDYPSFVSAFDCLIESRVDDPRLRLYYLNQFTSGDANEVIKGLVNLNSPEAYTKARKLLKERFGHPYRVAQVYKERLKNWAPIKDMDGVGLQKLSDVLLQTEEAMKTIQYMEGLNSEDLLKKICSKLPIYSGVRWCRRANDILRSEERIVSFHDLVKFVKSEADLATDPVFSPQALKEERKGDRRNEDKVQEIRKWKASKYSSSFSTNIDSPKSRVRYQQPEVRRCALCTRSHSLEKCQEFKKMNLKERKDFVMKKEMCFGCFGLGHMSRRCQSRKQCTICDKAHPTLLHDPAKNTSMQENSTQTPSENSPSPVKMDSTMNQRVSVCNAIGSCQEITSSLILPVWLYHQDKPNCQVMVYALLDPASNGTFIKRETMKKLGIDGVNTHLQLNTMHGTEVIATEKVTGLKLQDPEKTTQVELPKVYSRDDIPSKRNEIPRPEMAAEWDHLAELSNRVHPYRPDLEIGLLIGSNCPKAIKPREVIPGNDNDPYAVRTVLGWGIVGPVSKINQTDRKRTEVSCNRIEVREIGREKKPDISFVHETRVKEIIDPSSVNRMFEMDFNENSDIVRKSLSQDDRMFLDKVSKGIHLRLDGHYEIPLPFREDDIKLPNNKKLATYRLQRLKSRFGKDERYKEDYVKFMDEMIKKEHAEKVPPEEESVADGRTWYIPHHGVYHPRKPEKIRVVFDCSSEYKEESINKLIGVLTRFRQESVAFMSDIEAMFHQVKVTKDCRDFLRFLWWPHGDTSKEVETYRMTVHLFGAASSPGCSNFALKQTADDNEKDIGERPAEFLRKNFYVDDGLKSVPSVDEAVSLISQTKEMCSRGGFNLHKFISNKKEVIQEIPEEDRAKTVKNLDLDVLPVERVLGVQWCIEADNFEFRILLQDRPLTRRGVLATVSSIYDPLGFVAPIILTGKGILQNLCRDKLDWDDEIPDNIKMQWEKWRKELHRLKDLSIPRCFKPEEFGQVTSAELHHFSDASTIGYSQCSYLRLKNTQGKIHCSLVMGKSRVTPVKPVTIPRLELTAAVVSVKVSEVIKRELEYNITKELFWTDSQITLGYIGNDARRFHVYVANRVQQIRSQTSKDQWRYIDTSSNPADDGSRGLSAKQMLRNPRWITGPDFLWGSEDDWLLQGEMDISPEDPEVRDTSCRAIGTGVLWSLARALEYFSNWHRAKTAVAVCLRYRQRLLERIKSKKANIDINLNHRKERKSCSYQPVMAEDLQRAEIEIYKSVQIIHFATDVEVLKMKTDKDDYQGSRADLPVNQAVPKSSPLLRLNPFKDSDGVLRVGGRIKRAKIPPDVKFPVILPRNGHVTQLIITHYHEKVEHQGRGLTLNEIRANGVWIIGGSSVVAHLISKCVLCRKLRGTAQEQLMSDLPNDRLEQAPPFTYCAVDYCGPWYIKERRKELKRYVALFTCMASRAIHLEVSHTLETDSFIQALRRFLCRRGPVRQIRSDQGTNFVGARRELREALEEMDQERIRVEVLKLNCDWIEFRMNVPKASHMGGVWERQIKNRSERVRWSNAEKWNLPGR